MIKVCVSYASSDRQRLASIFAELQQFGLDLWYDQRMSAGDRWAASFRKELSRGRICVVFWSQASVTSDAVRAEYETALRYGPVVNVRLDQCQLPTFLLNLSRRRVDVADYSFIELDIDAPSSGIARIVNSVVTQERRRYKRTLAQRTVSGIAAAAVVIAMVVLYKAYIEPPVATIEPPVATIERSVATKERQLVQAELFSHAAVTPGVEFVPERPRETDKTIIQTERIFSVSCRSFTIEIQNRLSNLVKTQDEGEINRISRELHILKTKAEGVLCNISNGE